MCQHGLIQTPRPSQVYPEPGTDQESSPLPCLPAAAPKLRWRMAGTRGAECQERDVGDPIPSLPTPASQGMAKQAQLAMRVPGFARLISPLISSLAGTQPGSQTAESTPVPAGIRGCSLPRLRMWGDGSCPSIPQRQGKDAAGRMLPARCLQWGSIRGSQSRDNPLPAFPSPVCVTAPGRSSPPRQTQGPRTSPHPAGGGTPFPVRKELGRGGIYRETCAPHPIPGVAPSSPGALGACRDSLLQLPSGVIK